MDARNPCYCNFIVFKNRTWTFFTYHSLYEMTHVSYSSEKNVCIQLWNFWYADVKKNKPLAEFEMTTPGSVWAGKNCLHFLDVHCKLCSVDVGRRWMDVQLICNLYALWSDQTRLSWCTVLFLYQYFHSTVYILYQRLEVTSSIGLKWDKK